MKRLILLEGKNDLHFLKCIFLNSGKTSEELDEYINEGLKEKKSIAETNKLRSYIKNSKVNVLAKVENGKQSQRSLFREDCVNFISSGLYITVIFDLDRSPMDKNINERIEELRSRNPALNFVKKKISSKAFGCRRVDFAVTLKVGGNVRTLGFFSFFMFEVSLESTAKEKFPNFVNPLDGICELSKYFKVSDLFPSDL